VMPMSPMLFALVTLCGGLGAVLRYGIDAFISARTGDVLPWGTITINVSGSFALGFATGMAANAHLNEAWLLAVGTGLLGGYTTFSTATVDTLRLLQAGRPFASLANALGTLLATVLAALAGFLLSSLL